MGGTQNGRLRMKNPFEHGLGIPILGNIRIYIYIYYTRLEVYDPKHTHTMANHRKSGTPLRKCSVTN